ncbi:MAG: hypothetical protein ACI9CF_000670 [Candidatus Omnitrophota bacterium]|jgi:hypothetical protein
MKSILHTTPAKLLNLAMAITLCFAWTLTAQASTNEVIGTVVAVKKSGWATRVNGSVKRTVAPGEKIMNGDRLEVKRGNYVQIALDIDRENIIHIDQSSTVQLFSDGEADIQLSKGSVFAMLDNLPPGQGFKIATPTAVGSVRGTYYKIETDGLKTLATTYQGLVNVAGLNANGDVSATSSVDVAPARITELVGFDATPNKPKQINRLEFEAINDIIRLTQENTPQKILSYEEALRDAAVYEANRIEKIKAISKPSEDGSVLY